jgi:hypothetical protein
MTERIGYVHQNLAPQGHSLHLWALVEMWNSCQERELFLRKGTGFILYKFRDFLFPE